MIDPEEAFLIFKKWLDEKTPVGCMTSLFSPWGFALQGTVAFIDNAKVVRFDSADRAATLSLCLTEAEGFEYAEAKDLPKLGQPLASPRAGLLVAMPLRTWQPLLKRDKLFFWELPEA